jgi:4-amino-4-deoxy-L-arabinose transferase-like glycosyltransferase
MAGGMRWAEWGLVAVLGLAAAGALAYGLLVLFFGWEWFVGESLNAHFTDRLVADGELYADWTDDRLVFPIYPPGVYLAQAPFEAVFGYELWPGRLISIASFAFAAFAGFRIARRLGCSTAEALVSALGAFTFTVVAAGLVVANRPDALALGLTGAALLAATCWEEERERAVLLLAAATCVALIATKQNFGVIPVAILAAAWLRDRRAAVTFASAVAAGCLLVAGVAELASDGAFLRNMRDFADTGYSSAALRDVVEGALLPYPNPLLVVGALEAGFALSRPRSARSVHWAWLASLAVVLSAAKLGSAANYWLLTIYASAVLTGPALQRLRRHAGAAATAVAALLLALTLLPQTLKTLEDTNAIRDDLSALDDVNTEAAARMAAAGGEVFGDRSDLALAAGGPPSFDAAPFVLLERSGEWDPGPVAEAVRAGRFETIQSSFDLAADPVPSYQSVPAWPLSVIEAARASYCEVWSTELSSATAPGIWLYRPCPAGRSAPSGEGAR